MGAEIRIIVYFSVSVLILIAQCEVYDGVITVDEDEYNCFDEDCTIEFDPYSPLIKCEYLPEEFYECDDHLDIKKLNISEDGTIECQYDQENADKDEINTVLVNCTAFPGIECYGNRTFKKEVPCLKFEGHHFITILLFSVFLGFIGLDRFCLGHIPTAVGKLVTIGGLGVWWIIDVVLLVTGQLQPKNGSSWCP